MNPKEMEPRFFETPAELRRWFEKNHANQTELMLGLYKVHAAERGVTYQQALDEALCFGWIDGVRYGRDDDTLKIRFTPRKAKSIWSQVNVGKVKKLLAEGRMTPAGLAAYEARDPARMNRYSFENAARELPPEFAKRFKANEAAWKYFETVRPSYRKTAIHWVTSAKKEETRAKRLAELIARSEAGEWVRHLTPMDRRKK